MSTFAAFLPSWALVTMSAKGMKWPVGLYKTNDQVRGFLAGQAPLAEGLDLPRFQT